MTELERCIDFIVRLADRAAKTKEPSRYGAALLNTDLPRVWSRNYLESVQITMAESFGVEDRGHFYDPVGAVRDVVVNHLMQVVASAAMEVPSSGDAGTLKDAQVALFRAIADADPEHYVRGQYEGYREIDGVAPDSQTETYAAMRLDIDNWRWAGVPFFIRTGKHLAYTQTELRLVFKHPPRLGFNLLGRDAEPNQVVVKLDPTTGIRLVIEALIEVRGVRMSWVTASRSADFNRSLRRSASASLARSKASRSSVYKRSISRRPASASSARCRARAESSPVVTAVIRNTASAIQLSGSAIVNVPTGGRKKKLKQNTPAIDARTAGREPNLVATKSITSNSARATVVGLR